MELFTPRSPANFTPSAAESFLCNLDTELRSNVFDEAEHAKLLSVMARKLVDPATRQSYLHRFSGLLHSAVTSLFANNRPPRVLELGCGSGTASLLFASLGADVLALDLDGDLIRACRKRQRIYESQTGPLKLRFEASDVLARSFESDGMFDGIYSLFAFNTMQPTEALLQKLIPTLAANGVFMISDGNRESFYNRLFQRRTVLRPAEMTSQLHQLGCATKRLSYECTLPSTVWTRPGLLNSALSVERWLTQSELARWISTSYTLVACRAHSR